MRHTALDQLAQVIVGLLKSRGRSDGLAEVAPSVDGSPNLISVLTLLCGIGGIMVGLFLFFRGFQLLKRKRWIEDTPVSKIAGAAMGPVKIFGKATGPYTLVSPLSGVDCYYYRAEASSGQRAENEETLATRATESIFTPLFVEDETGRLMIDPRGAELDLPCEFDESTSGASMSECARRFLRRHGLSTEGETTVAEYAIKPGDPLLVLGTIVEPNSSVAYLSPEAADLQRREQWEAMGLPVRDMPAPSLNLANGFDVTPRAVLSSGRNAVLVLSREVPQHMIEGLARRANFGIWLGPPFAVFGLAVVLKWLGIW